MDVNHYKCRRCGTTMHSKARFGSREFSSASFIVQGYQGVMLGRVEDDPGRPPANPNDLVGWRTEENSPDHNFTMLTDYRGGFSTEHPRPVKLRLEHAKDIVIRISISEDDDDCAFDRIEMLSRALSPVFEEKPDVLDPQRTRFINAGGLTEDERKQLMCYLSGDHDYEFIGRQIDGHGPVVPK